MQLIANRWTTDLVEELRLRLLTEEPDDSIRADLRHLVIACLEADGPPLSTWTKDELSQAIFTLNESATKPGEGLAHLRIRFALLHFQLALMNEQGRDGRPVNREEVLDALTREMLLNAALAVPSQVVEMRS